MSCIRAIALAIALVWASSAEAAITVVQSAFGRTVTGGNTITVAFSGNTTTGNTIVVLTNASITMGFPVSGVSLSAGSGTFSRVVHFPGSGSFQDMDSWAAPSIVGGITPTVSVVFSNTINGSFSSAWILELSGMSSSLVIDGTPATLSGGPSTSLVSPPITTVNSGSIIFAQFTANGANPTIESLWTGQQDTSNGCVFQYQIQTTPTNLASTSTLSTPGTYGAFIFALSPVALPMIRGAVGNRHIPWN